MKNFDEIVKERFAFLEDDFGCEMICSKLKSWGYDIQYKNKTTGISIVYEFRENYIFIYLHKLIDEKIEKIPRLINDYTKLSGFSLDDIVNLKNPTDLMKPGYAYGEKSKYDGEKGWELYISKFADNLKRYGKDILKGDFSIFPKLDTIVKERVRSIQQKQCPNKGVKS